MYLAGVYVIVSDSTEQITLGLVLSVRYRFLQCGILVSVLNYCIRVCYCLAKEDPYCYKHCIAIQNIYRSTILSAIRMYSSIGA